MPQNAEPRKLTRAEARRKEVFDAEKASLEAEGYHAHNLTIGIVYANVMGIVITLPLLIILTILFLPRASFTDAFVPLVTRIMDFTDSPILVGLITAIAAFLLIVLLCVVHELIHGLVFGAFAPNHFKSIEFGIVLRSLTPYCTCTEPLTKMQYVLGSAMPLIVLGIVPGIFAVLTGSPLLYWIALIMIVGGGGDLLIIVKLLRFHPADKSIIYMDHPYECGLVAFEKAVSPA